MKQPDARVLLGFVHASAVTPDGLTELPQPLSDICADGDDIEPITPIYAGAWKWPVPAPGGVRLFDSEKDALAFAKGDDA